VTQENGKPWPYLSPTRDGWILIRGVGSELRRLVLSREIPCGTREELRPSLLQILGRFARLRQIVDNDILSLVTEAHFRGASWADIARCLERSKQTVHQRYSTRVHAESTHQRLAEELAQATEHVN
jgi:hypothetical protein